MDTDVRSTAPKGGRVGEPDGAEGSADGGESTAAAQDLFGVLSAVRGSVGVGSVPAGERSAGEWMDLVAECSVALGVVSAARDAAIVRLAAIDERADEDGVVTEQVNGLGTVCVDADAMVAAAVGCTTSFAQDLVEQAITRVVRVPGLHEAMLDGTLDDYRSRVVASELTDVPVDLARTVLDALGQDLASMSGPALRRRTRAILFRLSPDLLRERIRKARAEVGLRRWVGEPGTDAWSGRFPSEHAATAWAAIDALARRYRAEGTYPNLELARAHALLDLVHGNATIETTLHLTIPADALTDLDDLDDLNRGKDDDERDAAASDEGEGECRSGGDSGDSDAGCGSAGESDSRSARRRRASPERLAGAPARRRAMRVTAGADSDGDEDGGHDRTEPLDATVDDAAHGDTAEITGGEPGACRGGSDTSSAVAGQARLGSSGAAFVGASGAQGSAITWIPGSWLSTTSTACAPSTASASACASAGSTACDLPSMVCDPHTGALLDPADALATPGYRPGERLKALIRARDARCRFPGCTVAARVCDLDHVRPWPHGPTAATNLICLCRRHHRVKQRHRWHAALLPDGRVQWVDPRGRQLTTWPVDHLGVRETRVITTGGAVGAVGTSGGHGTDSGANIAVGGDGEPCLDAGRVETVTATVGASRPGTVETTPAVASTCGRESGSECRFAARAAVWCDHARAATHAGSRDPAVDWPFRRVETRHCSIELGVHVTIGGETLNRHQQQPPPKDPPPF